MVKSKRPAKEYRTPFGFHILSALCVLSIIALWVVALYEFRQLPTELVMQRDFSGAATRSGAKNELWFVLGIFSMISIGLLILARFPQVFNYPVAVTEQNAQSLYRLGEFSMIGLAAIAVAMTFSVYFELSRGLNPIFTMAISGFMLLWTFGMIAGFVVSSNRAEKRSERIKSH